MKAVLAIVAAGLAAACTMNAPVERTEADSAALAEATAGRVAGEPVACVNQVGLRNTRTVGDAILYEGPGDVLYVNHGNGGCGVLEHGRAIRTRTPSTRLCRGDIVTAFDPVSGMEFGGCSLGDFVPYRRAD